MVAVIDNKTRRVGFAHQMSCWGPEMKQRIIIWVFVACMLTIAPNAEAQSAKSVLEAAGIRGGVIVHLGCGDGRLARFSSCLLRHGCGQRKTVSCHAGRLRVVLRISRDVCAQEERDEDSAGNVRKIVSSSVCEIFYWRS